MRKRSNMCSSKQDGFTILELLVVFAIAGILFSMAFPSLGQVMGQMQAASDARALAYDIAQLRAEAIRQRVNIRISFTATGYQWDIEDDGSSEGNRTLNVRSKWMTSTPTSILFNGLGLARGIASQKKITIANGNYSTLLTLNKNGHVKL